MAGIFGQDAYRAYKKDMDKVVSEQRHAQLMQIDANYVHWFERLTNAKSLPERQICRRELKKIVDSYGMDLKYAVIPENRDKLITSCLPMVLALASKTLSKCKNNIYMEDLVQAGNLGLILGVDNALKTPQIKDGLSKTRAKLSTYLYFWVRKYMYQEAFQSNGFSGTVRDKEAATKYATFVIQRQEDNDGDEMANDRWDVKKVANTVTHDFKDLVMIEDEAKKFQAESKKMFSILSDKEKKILFMAYGIDTPNNIIYTQSEIAKAMGLSQPMIAKYMKNIMWKLQHSIKGMASGIDMINALCLIQNVDMTKVDDSAWKMPA